MLATIASTIDPAATYTATATFTSGGALSTWSSLVAGIEAASSVHSAETDPACYLESTGGIVTLMHRTADRTGAWLITYTPARAA